MLLNDDQDKVCNERNFVSSLCILEGMVTRASQGMKALLEKPKSRWRAMDAWDGFGYGKCNVFGHGK